MRCFAHIPVLLSRLVEPGGYSTPTRLAESGVNLTIQPNASAPPRTVYDVPVEVVEEYSSTTVTYVRDEHVARVRELAQAAGYHAVPHDEYDFIETGAGTIDTRHPITVPRRGRRDAAYAESIYGLYLVGFRAPIKNEWLAAIAAHGGIIVAGVPVNGQLVGATPAIARVLQSLPYVQWLEPYHPYLKGSIAPEPAGAPVPVIVDFAPIPGSGCGYACARTVRRRIGSNGDVQGSWTRRGRHTRSRKYGVGSRRANGDEHQRVAGCERFGRTPIDRHFVGDHTPGTERSAAGARLQIVAAYAVSRVRKPGRARVSASA